jgi:uncharacterized protein YqjF (DUF2071 family)
VQDGYAFASLVAFDFRDTRLRGQLKVPGHVNFPEINLRFYVKHRGQRAVVFWKELVPRFCIAFIANRLYNEPYYSTPMQSELRSEGGLSYLRHEFSWRGQAQRLSLQFAGEPVYPAPDSRTYYFQEHDLGFGVSHRGQTRYYEVIHPAWRVWEVQNLRLDVDFAHLYGPQWAFLAGAEPHAMALAEGSPVAVYPSRLLADWPPPVQAAQTGQAEK